jgi:hypothetical protein
MKLMWLCLLQVVSLSEDKMSVYWNCDSMLKWMDLTQKKQQQYYDSPHIVKWRDCKLSDIFNLMKIILFALFGVSEEEPVENFSDKELKNKNKIIGSIEKFMKKHKDEENICVSVLFVLVKAADGYVKFPVIRLLKRDINIQQNINIFIDFCGRVYKNWEDYLKNNTLPNCILCYPKNGVYSAVNGVVEVEYAISPAGKRRRKFLRGLDIGCTVLSVCATLVEIAARCVPVTLRVVAG